METGEYRSPLSRLNCFEAAEDDHKMWFARLTANGLYEYDKVKNRSKLLMRFLEYPVEKNFLYLSIQKVGDKLVLAPAAASKIGIYDLRDKRIDYLEVAPVEDLRKVKYTGTCDFVKSFASGDDVYLFGYGYPAVLKVNVKTNTITYLTDWVNGVEQRIRKSSVPVGYISDYVVNGDFIWALCGCSNVILRINLNTDEVKIIDIYSDLDIHGGICFDGNFWITGNNDKSNKLLKYSVDFTLKEEVTICSAENTDEYSFPLQAGVWGTYPIIDIGNKLLLFSVYPAHVYEFDKITKEAKLLTAFEKFLQSCDEKLYDLGILALRKRGKYIYFITGNDFFWNEYNYENGHMTRYEVLAECDGKLLQKAMAGRMISENEMVSELGCKLTFPEFLRFVSYISLE